jgi:hypothetical protein
VSAEAGRWLACAACAVALIGWWRARTVLRHDALILLGILLYFWIGTLDLVLFSEDWSPRVQVTQRVWTVVAIGVWGYLAGAWLGRRRREPRDARREVPRSRLLTDARTLEILGWVGLATLLLVYRAPALTGANREVESGYITSVAQLLIPAYLLRFAADRAAVSRWVWVRAIVAGGGLLASGYRTYTLVLLLGVLVVWAIQPRSIAQRVRAAVVGGLLLLVVGVGFGYWRFLREGNESGQDLVNSVFSSDATSLVQVTAGFTYVGLFREGPAILGEIVERHPDLQPYANGRALWGMLTSPLPGEQWDARAIVSQEVYGVRQTSLVSTIFGPWYLDFGLAGVFVGLGLMGYVLSRVESGALRRGDRVQQAAFGYGLVLVGLSIHTGLSDFVYAILLPAVFLWVGRSVGPHTPVPERDPGERRQYHPQDEGEVS